MVLEFRSFWSFLSFWFNPTVLLVKWMTGQQMASQTPAFRKDKWLSLLWNFNSQGTISCWAGSSKLKCSTKAYKGKIEKKKKKSSKAYKGQIEKKKKKKSRRNENISQTNEIFSRTNENISRRNEIFSRRNENISRTNEIVSRTNENMRIFLEGTRFFLEGTRIFLEGTRFFLEQTRIFLGERDFFSTEREYFSKERDFFSNKRKYFSKERESPYWLIMGKTWLNLDRHGSTLWHWLLGNEVKVSMTYRYISRFVLYFEDYLMYEHDSLR